MSFATAIPVNRTTQRPSGFGSSMGERKSRFNWSSSSKQSVNISQETTERIVKAKLSNVLHSKLAYSRSGKLGMEASVGQMFSAKA